MLQSDFPINLKEFQDQAQRITQEFPGCSENSTMLDKADVDTLCSIPIFKKRASHDIGCNNTVFDAVNCCNWTGAYHVQLIKRVETAFWKAINTPSSWASHKWDENCHKFMPVALPLYGADIDTGLSGSGFPHRSGNMSVCDDGGDDDDGGGDDKPILVKHAMKRRRRKRRRKNVVDINNCWNLNSLPFVVVFYFCAMFPCYKYHV